MSGPPLLADRRVRRVALVRLRVGLGDLLCSLPAWRALRRFRPDLHVCVVTWPEMAPLLRRMGAYVDELLPFPGYPGIPERPPDRDALPAFLDAAARRRFDVAVQTYGDNPAANAVCGLLGARHVAGFQPRGWTPVRDPGAHLPYPDAVHETLRHLQLFAHLGVPVDGPGAADLELAVYPWEAAGFDRLLARQGLRAWGYAVLHPGATSPSRRWPARRFAAVGDALAGRGLRVVLGGVRSEAAVTGDVRRRMRAPVLDLTGRTTLGEYALLLRGAGVVVANDTGAAHLAAVVGARTVTVFLSGDPRRWAHAHASARLVRASVGCSPCRHLDCPIDFRCATGVTVQAVLDQVDRLMG